MTTDTLPEGAVTEVTPSGLAVYYQPNPRLYRVGSGDYWVEVPSVTTILEVLPKFLQHWGERVGIAGIVHLYQQSSEEERQSLLALLATEDPHAIREKEALSLPHLLKVNGLSVTQIRDKAGDRGTSIHGFFENWARLGWSHIPQPGDVPESEQGYLAALRKVLETIKFEPEGVEVMVGSIKHGYAGRYDLRASLAEDIEVAINSRRKALLPKGKYLVDLKTSSGVYPSHHLQLAAYEGASVECGYEPTDYRLVIQVGSDGKYDLRVSRTNFDDFLAVLDCYMALERVKAGMKVKG